MITRESLPRTFTPYNELKICSNTLIDGGYLFSIGDILPLVIGKGEKPQIWLEALNDPKNKEFVTIVEDSISKHSAVRITETSGILTITIQGKKILSIYNNDENSAEVDYIDLRPLGFNIYGDKNHLIAGNSTFSANSMSGGSVLIGFST